MAAQQVLVLLVEVQILVGQPVSGGIMSSNILNTIRNFLTQKGYGVETSKRFQDPQFSTDLYATFKGYGLWKLFPFEDHIFVYDLSGSASKTKDKLSELHEFARKYVNAQFKTPKWMRYKVPNIVTVIFANDGFPDDMIEYASKESPYGVGGEKHSMHLVDLLNKKVHNQGLQTVRVGMIAGSTAPLSVTHKKVNPTNRVFFLIEEMSKKLFI